MSPHSQTSTTTRQRRPSGKPGRFDPSEPLHMTTRRAAKGPANRQSNGSGSIDGSIDESESRRGSLDDLRPTTSHSLGSQTLAGSRQVSGTSIHDSADINLSFESRSSAAKKSERFRSDPFSSNFSTTSPSRKRKRNSPTSSGTPTGSGDDTVPLENEIIDRHPLDFVEVIPMDQLSDRAASESSPSDDELAEDYGGVAQSTEITPAATPLGFQPVSPISETSMQDDVFSSKVIEPLSAKVTKSAVVEEAEDVDDAEDLVEADEIEEGDDVDEDHTRLGPRRRIAGRRRADHPDPRVEATLRRQLQLKSAFRAITRSLKPILAEIALKTTEELDNNPHLHEEVPEYQGTGESDGVQKQLDDILARRKAQIEAQYKWNKQNLHRTFEGESSVRNATTKQKVNDLREVHLDRLEYDMLRIARKAQMSTRDSGNETDDEDDNVIRARQGMQYRFVRTGPLDSEYESGSRLALEGELAMKDLQARFEVFQALRDHIKAGGQTQSAVGFTVMDDTARQAANARRQSVLNTKVLADAATERERIDNLPVVPVIPNEQAHDLQMLAKLATRPAIQPFPYPVRPNKPPQHPLGDPFQPQSQRMGPPQTRLRPPISFDRPPPQASPRSTLSNDIVERALNRQSESPRQKAEPSRSDLSFLLSSPAGTYRREEPSPNVPVKPTEPASPRHESVPPSPIPRSFQHNAETMQLTPGRMSGEDSLRPNANDRGDLSSEQYHRPLTARSPRFAPSVERPLHQFSSGPLSIARVDTSAENDNSTQVKEQKREGLIPHPTLPPKPPSSSRTPFDPPSNPGAPDSRFSQERAELFSPRKASIGELLQRPRSRASSEVSQSTATEATADSSNTGESEKGQSRHKSMKVTHKNSRNDRNGLSRRLFKQRGERGERRPSNAEPPEGKPQIMRFRLNGPPETSAPARTSATSAPTVAPPQVAHHDHYQTHPYGSLPGFPGLTPIPPPSPMPRDPYPYSSGYDSGWHHRRSLQGPLPPAPGYQPSPGPSYGIPPGFPPMLPTGLPGGAMDWPHLLGPPAYRHASQPSTPHQGPNPPPGQFGGPTIAPASDHRSSYGSGSSGNLPAFAQQKRQDEGSSRRRAQSDFAKRDFKHYDPTTKAQKR